MSILFKDNETLSKLSKYNDTTDISMTMPSNHYVRDLASISNGYRLFLEEVL